MQPSKALIEFHKKFFSGTSESISSDLVFAKLLEEINNLKERAK